MGFLDPSSWANAFGADDASANAINSQNTAAAGALGLQQRQFDYAKGLQQPFYNAAMPAFYQLASAVTGQPQSYVDPNAPGAKTLTDQEIRAANIAAIQKQFPTWNDQQISIGLQREENLPYRTGETYYRDANGGITTQAPASAMKSTGVWQPTDTPAYNWQQEQAQKNNSRTLRSLGRENSSYGMGEQFKSQQNLAANEYDKQLSRLAMMTGIAGGGAASLASAGSNYAGNAASSLINSGNNNANAYLAGGMMNQNNLYNGQQNGMSLANLGLKAYNSGMFGGGGSGYEAFGNGSNGSGWDTTSGQWGDSSYSGDGQLWD